MCFLQVKDVMSQGPASVQSIHLDSAGSCCLDPRNGQYCSCMRRYMSWHCLYDTYSLFVLVILADLKLGWASNCLIFVSLFLFSFFLFVFFFRAVPALNPLYSKHGMLKMK